MIRRKNHLLLYYFLLKQVKPLSVDTSIVYVTFFVINIY
jgi:hypothetical protein